MLPKCFKNRQSNSCSGKLLSREIQGSLYLTCVQGVMRLGVLRGLKRVFSRQASYDEASAPALAFAMCQQS